ncbi:hypothetical protein PT181_00540 [Erysipelothrix rhusiopathiae]|nr:hypothetical protein [Erysipelothrix rhusiopathiae]MDE8037319.1 hypothetical protein [Erysipelothrix rhusiopathiae]MDE8038664.1 hypothetical protein [Erysipelothrix rhusiopathiae]MDE8044391.1 hypothetical protein [Erysipelothrix rhusiopathiae]MDE8057285.1 hypothetical protein [Erysipelothrix rhusiopathiae]
MNCFVGHNALAIIGRGVAMILSKKVLPYQSRFDSYSYVALDNI